MSDMELIELFVLVGLLIVFVSWSYEQNQDDTDTKKLLDNRDRCLAMRKTKILSRILKRK